MWLSKKVFVKRFVQIVDRYAQYRGEQPFSLRAASAASCTLEKAAVDGRRICYFDQGHIAQEVPNGDRPIE